MTDDKPLYDPELIRFMREEVIPKMLDEFYHGAKEQEQRMVDWFKQDKHTMKGGNMTNSDSLKERYIVEERDEWSRWCEEIPELQFPSSWKVKIIPPFNGAIVRFRINDKISVYLDCYDRLGYMGEPYWEIYPYYKSLDDIWRCPMNNTDDLIAHIDEALETS